MTDRLTAYLDELESELAFRETPLDVIVDVSRQVQSHSVETGEDPYETFGTPAEYARAYAPRATSTRFWVLLVLSVIMATGGGFLLSDGIIAAVAERPAIGGLPAPAVLAAAVILLASWVTMLSLAAHRHRMPSPVGRTTGRAS